MGEVGPVARALGYAGLLPQVAAVGGIILQRNTGGPWLWAFSSVAFLYASVILSFLGGTWWGMVMRRADGQGRLAAISVVPSLVAMAVLILSDANYERGWGLVAIGCSVLLTLPVDRHLASTREAPEGWMSLRVPLSLGLGGLTIAAGALYGA